MTAIHPAVAPPLPGRGPGRRSGSSTDTTAAAKQFASPLSSLYVSLAMLGVAALASAAASSLLPGIAGHHAGADQGGALAAGAWVGGIFTGFFAVASLLYGIASFRAGRLLKSLLARRVLAVAATVHLAALLAAAWRMPADTRTFDVNLAALMVLELSAIAVIGWQRNTSLRRPAGSKTGREPSAARLVGTLFASSILVAAIASAGMAASTAGQLAVPHSGHGSSHSPSVPGNILQLQNEGHHH
ncbi:MAG: hypothetical protein WBX27_03880 [Specibacter sp.]